MTMRRAIPLALAVACLGLMIAGWAAPRAPAAFPGQNGKIAFNSNRDGNNEIYTMNADGSGQVRRTTTAADDRFPTWSPDGSKIAFQSNRDGNAEVYTMNADGSGQVNRTTNAAGDGSPAWSPDGTKIAFVRDGDIYTMNADGSAQVPRETTPGLDAQPEWSPDGTKIAFTSFRDGNFEVYTMNADGTGQVNRSTNAARDDMPSWSPDGTKIAFMSDRDGSQEIYTMNADGSGQVNRTTNGGVFPAWSPDGTKIAFISASDGNIDVYTMNADGSGQVRRTTNPNIETEPDWGPAGAACPDVQVGFATAKGCFTETAPGSGIFRTDQKAWVGGFQIEPRGGGKLALNTNTPGVSTSGAGADVVFAGFKVPIPVSALPVGTQSGSFSIASGAGSAAQVLDIPVEASVKLAWTDGGRSATYEQKVAIAKLTEKIGQVVTPPGTAIGDVGGALKAKLQNGVGFVLQQAEVRIDKLTLLPDKLKIPRKLELRDLLLRFERKDNKPFWTGRGGITLPFRDGLGFTGTVFVFDGSLAGGGLAITGINKQLGGTPLFLQDVSGDLLFAPRWGHDLAIKGSAGPRVNGKDLLKLTGQLKGGELITPTDCPSGDDPEKLLMSSKFTPLEPLEIAGLASSTMSLRGCVYPYAGLVPSMDVTATVGIDFANGALAYEASQTGFVSASGANLEGAATLKVPGIQNINGSAIVSTKGTAACASAGFFDAGFGHRWGEGVPSAFTGCDLAPFRVTASARSADAHAAGVGTIEVPKGLPHAGFAATAEGGAPRVTVSGPGGVEVSSPPDGSVLRTPQALIVPVANERTTYVFVDDPRPGTWSVDSAEPDNPLTKVGFAEGLEDAKVKAKVAKGTKRKQGKKGKKAKKGKGSKFKLAYNLRRIPGQQVTFTERGEGIAQKLGTARGRKGTISFKPTISADRARTIEAEVTQDGLPRELLTVAKFKAPKQPKIKKPKVKAKRKPDSLKLTWKRVKGAGEYLVEVSAGTEVLQRVITPSRKLRLDGTPAEGKLAVTVQALSEVQPPGPARKLEVKAPRG